MRIALFTGNYNYLKEGANQALNRLVGYLEQERGHSLRVYSPVSKTPAFAPTGTLIPVPSVTLPFRTEFRLATGLPRALRADIRAFRPDLLHVATPDILGRRAQDFAGKIGVPVVASLHTRFETYLDYYGIGWSRPLIARYLDRFYRRSAWVLVPTRPLLRDMAETRGDDRASIWSRGVDRDVFIPARRDAEWRAMNGWGNDDVVVLFFGRLVAEKEVATFVSVMQRIQARDSRVRVLVVGAGPAEDQFRQLRDPVFTGHLDGAALAGAIASADILLNPSTTETFGNVVLEAMAAGLAVVCADVDSARELIDDGRTGLLCRPGDHARYVAAVSRLAQSREERERLGRAARAATERYSWQAASRAVEEAYVEVLRTGIGR